MKILPFGRLSELYGSVYKSANSDEDDDSIHLAESLVRARKTTPDT